MNNKTSLEADDVQRQGVDTHTVQRFHARTVNPSTSAPTSALDTDAQTTESPYKSLEPNEFRLLEIFAGDDQSPLRARLVRVSLAGPPAYNALSHTRRSSETPFSVNCEGIEIRITQNLHAALCKIRQTDKSILIWTDAICINQDDEDEVSQQEKLKDKICAMADRTIPWITLPVYPTSGDEYGLPHDEPASKPNGFWVQFRPLDSMIKHRFVQAEGADTASSNPPEGDPHQTYAKAGLSRTLLEQFKEDANLKDLEDAILAAPGESFKVALLVSLAEMYRCRYERQGLVTALDSAMRVQERALCLENYDGFRIPFLLNLGWCLLLKYERTRWLKTLIAAISKDLAAASIASTLLGKENSWWKELSRSLTVKIFRLANRSDIPKEWVEELTHALAAEDWAALQSKLRSVELELREQLVSDEPFSYQPLRNSKIRLIKLKKRLTRHEAISCELADFSLDEKPYVALSYVWGSREGNMEIAVNGRRLSVTQNLFDALLQLEESSSSLLESLGLASSELLVWIDAICIDQKNMDEKSREVSRMEKIYSSAHVTLVWFGSSKPLHPAGARLLHKMATSIADHLSEASDPSEQDTSRLNVKIQFKEGYHEVIRDIFSQMVINEWFDRVWVVQEYALSQRDPQALWGDMLFPMRSLAVIAKGFRGVPELVGTRFSMMEGIRRSRLNGLGNRSAAEQILFLLGETIEKRCTDPRDRVYGLLGMVTATLEPSLRVDYDEKVTFQQVFRHYTQHIIECTKTLSVLCCAKKEEDLKEWPSWIPDLRHAKALGMPRHTDPHIAFDGDKLIVHGFEIGRILAYSDGEAHNLDNNAHISEWLQNFQDTILVRSARIRGLPLDDVFRQWLSRFCVIHSLDSQFLSLYQRMGELIELMQLYTVGLRGQQLSDELLALGALQTTVLNSTHCVLDNGDILLYFGHEDSHGEDERVWMWKGFDGPVIVRHTAKGCQYSGFLLPLGEIETILDKDFWAKQESSGPLEEIWLV